MPPAGEPRSARRGGSPYPKAELWPRFLARTADFLVAFVFGYLIDTIGPLLAVVYLLVMDGLPNGQSPGKRLFGIKCVHLPTRTSCDVRRSVIRNIPLALAAALCMNVFLFVSQPLAFAAALFTNLILFIVGSAIVFFEAHMVQSDGLGCRIGDIFADTQVIDAKVPLEAAVPQPSVRAELRTLAPVDPAEVQT